MAGARGGGVGSPWDPGARAERARSRAAVASGAADEERLLERSLEHARAVFGEHSEGMAETLGRLGEAHFESGAFLRARTAQQDALRLWRELCGGRSVEAARAMHALGLTLHALGDHVAGDQLLQHSQVILDAAEALEKLRAAAAVAVRVPAAGRGRKSAGGVHRKGARRASLAGYSEVKYHNLEVKHSVLEAPQVEETIGRLRRGSIIGAAQLVGAGARRGSLADLGTALDSRIGDGTATTQASGSRRQSSGRAGGRPGGRVGSARVRSLKRNLAPGGVG